MATPVIFLDQDEDGIYEVPTHIVFNADETWDTLEKLVVSSKERGKLRLNGKTFMVTIHVERVAGMRYPYLTLDDLRKLK